MTWRMLLIVTLATLLVAQMPPPAATDQIRAYLNLQDSQIQALVQLQQQQRQAAQSLLSELAAKQQTLRDQLDRGSSDAAALGKLLLETEALRKRLNDIHTSYRTQAVSLLTPEQKTKLAALEQALKLEPALRQALALGLLSPPEAAGLAGPVIRGFGRGPIPEGLGPMRAPGAAAPGLGPGPMRLRTPHGFPSPQQ